MHFSFLFLTTLFSIIFTQNALAANSVNDIINSLESTPYKISSAGDSTKIENDTVFKKFCVGDSTSADIPRPNYSNSEVVRASHKLSETKLKADEKLAEMAKKSFKSNVESAIAQTENLKQSKYSDINNFFKLLSIELKKAKTEGKFSDSTKTTYSKIQDIYLTNLKNTVPLLAEKITTELKGVNINNLKKIGLTLIDKLKKELKTPDYIILKNSASEIVKHLPSELKEPSLQVISDLNKNLKDLLKDIQATQTNLFEAKKISDKLEEKIESTKGNKNKIYDVNYAISDINYYLSAEKTSGKLSPHIEKILIELKKQESYFSNENIKSSLAEVKKNLDSKGSEQDLMYACQSLSYYLNNISSKNQILNAAISSLKLEINKFNSQEILNTALETEKKINTHNESVASNQELIESCNSLAGWLPEDGSELTLSPEASTNLKLFREELALSESDYIKASANKLADTLKKSNSNIDDNLSNEIFDFKYKLVESLKLSESALKLANDFKSTTDELESYWPIFNTLKTSIETKSSQHFYFYSPVKRIYKLSNSVPADAPPGTVAEAHQFLTQLCGEFRDRASFIGAKIRWVNNIFILDKNKTEITIDPSKNIWSQMQAHHYSKYLGISRQIWDAKRDSQPRYITVGDNEEVDNPVTGLTVCETKYLFSDYITKNKPFDNLAKFNQGYEVYKKNCPKADTEDYYDFRGDSNFKHYSPESNGMIWYATSLASACKSPTEVKSDSKNFTREDCENYFKNPFYYRYNAARAGLATWLFRDERHASTFAEQGAMVAIYPHNKPELAPFSFSFDQSSTEDVFEMSNDWLNLKAWNQADMGYNSLTGLGTNNLDENSAYIRIRDAVDRHTDWYNSGFNDKNGNIKNQAYSPFVASSYEMSASNGFTQCGPTVNCPDDGLKRWMFIFRVKPKNWYTPVRILNNEPVNFDTMWFDETSFGVSGLADGEKAWDRLGTPMEEEFDSILYLINASDDWSGGFEGDEEGGH